MLTTRSKHIHAPGIITLATDVSGTDKNSVFACSSDETFCVWTCSQGGEFQENIQNCSSNCRGVLAIYGEDIFIGETSHDPITENEQQVVVKYSRSTFLASMPILTFSLEVTALACSKKYLVAGSNDFTVKCLNMENDNRQYDRYECDHIIVNLSINPTEEYFTISTADGAVQIKPIKKPLTSSVNAKKPLAKFKAVTPFKHITVETPRMRCTWNSSGSLLFIPARSGVLLISTDEWKQVKILTHPSLSHATFSVSAITSDDKHFASCTIDGTVSLWSIDEDYMQFQLLSIRTKIVQGIGTITSLLFNPSSEGTLILGYSEGYLCGVLDASRLDPQVSDAHLSNDTGVLANDEDMETDIGLIKSQFGFDRHGVHVSERIDETSSLLAPQQRLMLEHPCTTVKGMRTPKTFMNGSTPMHNSQRYLAWNMFGLIRSYRTGDESTIEINFHDSSTHSEIVIDNTTNNYVLGDLNTNLVALASQKNANKESELIVYDLNAWDIDSRQWSQKIGPSDTEMVECLSVGSNFIALFTSLRYLRIFTSTGTQRIVASQPGPILTMCAFQYQLVTVTAGAVIVHSEDDYEQIISANIYELDVLSPGICLHHFRTIPLPLGPDTDSSNPLRWISHSFSGQLVTMDSACTVRIFNASRSLWFPIVVGTELLKEPELDSIWPIAIFETPLSQFRYAYCRGSNYPSANKPIVPTTITWSLPMLNSDTDRGKYEEELLVTEIQQAVLRVQQQLQPESDAISSQLAKLSKTYLTDVIKLFAISCQSGRESRAAELVHRSTTGQGIQTMCSYASKKQRPRLSEKVAELGRERIHLSKSEDELSSKPKFPSVETTRDLPINRILSSQLSSISTQSQLTSIPAYQRNLQLPNKVLLTKRKQVATDDDPLRDLIRDDSRSGRRMPVDIANTQNEMNSTRAEASAANKDISSLDESALNAMFSNSANDSSAFLNDSSIISVAVNPSPANNPFKRSKIATNDERRGMDFFDSLSSLGRGKLAATSIEPTKSRNKALENMKSKRQSSLLTYASSTALEPNNSLASISTDDVGDDELIEQNPSAIANNTILISP